MKNGLCLSLLVVVMMTMLISGAPDLRGGPRGLEDTWNDETDDDGGEKEAINSIYPSS